MSSLRQARVLTRLGLPAFVLACVALAGCGIPPEDLESEELRALEDGLLLHWTVEDRAGDTIFDLTGNGRDGTAQGGAAFVSSPQGEAISFDGVDDFVSFAGPRDPALYGGVDGAFTVSARVKLADVGKANTLCYGCGPLNSMYIGDSNYSDRVLAALFDQGTAGLTWPLSNPALVADTWTEVTMIVEGGVGTRYYLDCSLDAEVADTDVGLKDYGYSSVGQGGSASKWFGGELDELRIWNRALSDTELAQLCPSSLTTGLELHWTVEDRAGDTIFDLSGKGRDGTAQGGATFVTSPQGEAISFDGVDDFVSFAGPRDPALYGGVDGAFTISARVKLADVGKANTLCYGCGPLNSMYVGDPSYSDRVLAALFDQGTTGLTWPLSNPALVADTWTEVTMIVEGGVGTRYYLDCSLDAEVADTDVGLKDYGYSSVGQGGSASKWFGGELDELRIWNRALSDTELAELCPVSDPLAEGLELHWTMEDRVGDTITDLSGKGRDGTAQNGASFVASPAGEAISLDGVDDFISMANLADSSVFGGTSGSFTISAQVKVADVHKDNVLCYRCAPFYNLLLGLAKSQDDGNQVYVAGTGAFPVPTSSLRLVDDTWTKVTVVVTGGEGVRIYLDGALNAEHLDPDVAMLDGGYSSVGEGSSGSSFFGGEIDELRIWSRALSAAEVDSLVPGDPLLPLDVGLKLRWTMEDRFGDSILDMSGEGFHNSSHSKVYVPSPKGEALAFNGVDEGITVTDFTRDPAEYGGVDGSFTVSASLRVSDLSKANTICFGCGPFNSLSIGTFSQIPQVWAKLYDETSTGFFWPSTSGALSEDTWMEVTMTVDGTEGARTYIDCELDGQLLNADIGLSDYLYTGVGEGSGANGWFGGDIDEFAVWDRVLSDDEISALCQ